MLACGGFEWNDDMVRAFIGREIFPLSPPHNEGDGHRMAMEAGAALANMTSFWGQPAMLDPEVDFEGNLLYQMGTARSAKGVILVNRTGKRFVNEGVTYQDFPKALGAYDPVALDYPTENVWMIFDQHTKDTTVLLPSILPGSDAARVDDAGGDDPRARARRSVSTPTRSKPPSRGGTGTSRRVKTPTSTGAPSASRRT